MAKNNKTNKSTNNATNNATNKSVSNAVSNINDYDSLPEVANSVVNTAYSNGKTMANNKAAANCKSKHSPTDCK